MNSETAGAMRARPKPNDAFTRKQAGRLAAALRDELLQFRQFVENARAVRQI